jgi:hypothetical protein
MTDIRRFMNLVEDAQIPKIVLMHAQGMLDRTEIHQIINTKVISGFDIEIHTNGSSGRKELDALYDKYWADPNALILGDSSDGKFATITRGTELDTDPTSNEAFRRWFGNSKIVDESGKPLLVYHGTKTDFDTFDLGRVGSNNDTGMWGTGFYFSPDKNMSQGYGEKIKSVYLSIQNPLVVKQIGSLPKEFRPSHTHGEVGKAASDAQREHILAAGYDGVIHYETSDRGTKTQSDSGVSPQAD